MPDLGLVQLRPKQVAERLGCCLAKVYELAQNDPDFPKPVSLSQKWTFWYACEIDAWSIKKAAAQQGVSVEEMTERLAAASAFSQKVKALMAN